MTPSLIPLCSAITFIVVPFISPVSVNARLAAARIELFLASAVSRRRTGGGASPAGLAAALGTRCPRLPGPAYGECAHTPMLTRGHLYSVLPAHSFKTGARRGQLTKRRPIWLSTHSLSSHGGSTSCAPRRTRARSSEVLRVWKGSLAPLRKTRAGTSIALAAASGSPGTTSSPHGQ